MKPEGAEIADVELADGRLSAHGAAIGSDPLPYRLEYELTTEEEYVTTRLLVRTNGITSDSGSWQRVLELTSDPDRIWTIKARAEGRVPLPPPGGDATALEGALDCDLGLSPLTNTMPVLRSGLLAGGGPLEHLMAWVSVPDLAVTPSRQTYTFIHRDSDHSIVNYSSPGFTQDITFDPDGFVLNYPSIGHRV